MKFAGKELRSAYDTLLHETITVNGATVKCYDSKATSTAVKPYIIFSTYNQNGNVGSKDSFGYNATLNIEIVDGFVSIDNYDRSNVDYIANQILDIVRPTTQSIALSLASFNVISLNLSASFDTFLETEQENLFRNILVFEHTITQN